MKDEDKQIDRIFDKINNIKKNILDSHKKCNRDINICLIAIIIIFVSLILNLVIL